MAGDVLMLGVGLLARLAAEVAAHYSEWLFQRVRESAVVREQ